jgi:hypothetical protein
VPVDAGPGAAGGHARLSREGHLREHAAAVLGGHLLKTSTPEGQAIMESCGSSLQEQFWLRASPPGRCILDAKNNHARSFTLSHGCGNGHRATRVRLRLGVSQCPTHFVRLSWFSVICIENVQYMKQISHRKQRK